MTDKAASSSSVDEITEKLASANLDAREASASDEKQQQQQQQQQQHQQQQQQQQEQQPEQQHQQLQEQLVSKGKPRQQQHAARAPCNDETRTKIREILIERRPMDYSVDAKTLNTPIHRFLENPKNAQRPGHELVEPLSQLLSNLLAMDCLPVYINMANKFGRTPLSLCLRNSGHAELIAPLIQWGAQIHYLCGKLDDRCNHLHYAMMKSSPEVIDTLLDEVSRSHPFGAEGMYSMNRIYDTPKAVLQRRMRDATDGPEVQRELGRILGRIQGYPPVDELPGLA